MQKGLCSEKDEEKCAKEFGKFYENSCKTCDKKRNNEISDYTWKIVRLYNLQMAGYPLSANDLTLEEWLDLGKIKQAFDTPLKCPFMGSKNGSSKHS